MIVLNTVVTKQDTGENFRVKLNMSIVGALRDAQITSQALRAAQPENNSLNVSDRLRVRQMERVLEQTLEELAQVKAKVNELDKLLSHYAEHHENSAIDDFKATPLPSKPLLPIDEIKELAEMAKRFK
jgi:hypothetical protein